jgi:hypothetical protein
LYSRIQVFKNTKKKFQFSAMGMNLHRINTHFAWAAVFTIVSRAVASEEHYSASAAGGICILTSHVVSINSDWPGTQKKRQEPIYIKLTTSASHMQIPGLNMVTAPLAVLLQFALSSF